MSLPVTSSGTIQSVRISNLVNLSGVASGLSGGPQVPDPIGLAGTAKVCLVFAPGCGSAVTVPLSPVANTGIGIGGVQTIPGEGWFVYLRLYGPEAPYFDKTWIPGDAERVE